MIAKELIDRVVKGESVNKVVLEVADNLAALLRAQGYSSLVDDPQSLPMNGVWYWRNPTLQRVLEITPGGRWYLYGPDGQIMDSGPYSQISKVTGVSPSFPESHTRTHHEQDSFLVLPVRVGDILTLDSEVLDGVIPNGSDPNAWQLRMKVIDVSGDIATLTDLESSSSVVRFSMDELRSLELDGLVYGN